MSVLDESIHFFNFLFGTAAGLQGAKDAGGNWQNCSTLQRLSGALVQAKGLMSSFLRRKVASACLRVFEPQRPQVTENTRAGWCFRKFVVTHFLRQPR
jgi:hypothetical protein